MGNGQARSNAATWEGSSFPAVRAQAVRVSVCSLYAASYSRRLEMLCPRVGSGDVAENYLRSDWQTRREPYAEGDVVGFVGKEISLNTKRCDAVGIVSTRAMLEGSNPDPADRYIPPMSQRISERLHSFPHFVERLCIG